MRGNISIIKKLFVLQLFTVFSITLSAEPYKPYPILFVHGINSGSGTWGVPVENREVSDSIPSDSVMDNSTYKHFLNYMNPYAIAWWELDETYTKPGDPAYPNKTFLEVVNFDEIYIPGEGMKACASIDPDLNNPNPNWRYRGEGQELYERVEEVMKEYYGESWEDGSDSKIIFVAHSGGGMAVRECIFENPQLKPHIYKVITLGSPHAGCEGVELVHFFETLRWIETVKFFVNPFMGIGWYSIYEYLWLIAETLLLGQSEELGVFSPLGEDCSNESDFLKTINSPENFQGDGFSWHCLVGKGGYGIDKWGERMRNAGYLITAGGILKMNPYAMLIGIDLIWKGNKIYKFGRDTDGLMAYWDADINYANSRYKAEVKTIYPLSHTDEPKKWTIIRNFIEYPPRFYWDTLFASKYVVDSITQDTIFMDTVIDLKNENPELGTYRPDSISGKIYNYFLAQCEINLHLNIMNWDPLTWENGDFGRNGNKFVIKDLMERGVFPGWNRLKASAVNVLDQKTSDQIRFFFNPFLTYLEFKAPLDEDCFKSSTDTAAVVYFSDNRSPLQAESLSVIFEDSVILDTAVVYAEEDSVYQDTLRVPFSSISSLEEGMYLIKAVVRNNSEGSETAKSIISIYIDDTPPEPLITLPLEEDSVVHSSRVKDMMPFVFTISDNLDDIIYKPQNGKVVIGIRDPSDNLVWEDTIGANHYNLPKRIYWNFKDSDSNKVTNSRRYKVILSCLDKAGNLGSDTSFFFLDNEPPVITVLSAFNSILTSNEEYVELDYQANENAEVKLKWTDIDEKWVIRDGFASPAPDTNYLLEGPDMYGNYLTDGLYTAEITVKDNAGNDTTYNEGIVQGDILRVDRTPPSIRDLYVPWLADPESNVVNVFFNISEEEDFLDNKGKVIIKIYIGKDQVDSLEKSPEVAELEVDKEYNISGLKNGIHKVTISAEDRWGNINTQLTEVVKGTIGTKITHPEEGDTLGQGWVIIKGLANDPDINNGIPLGGFGLYYKPTWDSTKIIVPENLREPGIPENRGIKPVPNVSDIARWNTDSLSGFYDLLLKSWEEGDSIVLADTVNVFIESEPMISPSISDFVVNIVGGSNNDTIFEPAEEETLIVDYKLENKPADISFDVLNKSGRNMAHLEQKGIMPDSITPPTLNKEGIYLYFYDNKWWVRWKLESLGMISGNILSLENKSFSIIDTLDNLISFNGSLPGKIDFKRFYTSSLNEGGFSFTGEGRIQFDSLTFNGVNDVWVGGCKLQTPLILALASPFSYYGTKFGEGHIPGGRYTVRVSANGIDGIGYNEECDTITTETDLKITECKLTSDRADPLDTLGAATLEYMVNQKAAVKIDVYKGGVFFHNIECIDSVAGERKLLASWNGVKGNTFKYGDDYNFKITAYSLPDSSDSDSVFSDSFTVESLPSAIGDFFIHPDYYVGEVHNDSVFNGKTDFLWETSAAGAVYPPQEYTFADTAKAVRKIDIDWEVEAEAWILWGENGEGLVDSAIDYYGSSSGNMADTNFFYLDYVHPADNPRASYYQAKYEYCAEGGQVALDTNELAPWDLCFSSDTPFFCAEGGETMEERWLHLEKKLPKIERLCIGALTWSHDTHIKPRIYATYNFPYPVDAIVTGNYTITGNIGEDDPDEIAGFQADITPKDDFFYNGDKIGGRLYKYTLKTTINGNTLEISSEESPSPDGELDLKNNNVFVRLDLKNNEIYAWIDDTLDSSTKWIKVAEKTGTCYPLESGGGFSPDTTLLWEMFTIPSNVDFNTVRFSDPVPISGNVNLTKTVSDGGDSCIVATVVDDLDSTWISNDDILLTNGEIKGKGRFTDKQEFVFNGLGEESAFSDFYPTSIDTQDIPEIPFHVRFYKRGFSPGSSVLSDFVYLRDTFSVGEVAERFVDFNYFPEEETYAESIFVQVASSGFTSFKGSETLEKGEAEWHFEREGVDFLFGWVGGQDLDRIYVKAYNTLLTFWENGNSSNDYLNIKEWNLNLLYPSGEENTDLFVEPPPPGVTPPEYLLATYGYGRGVQDYFLPFHFLVPTNVPRNYVEIDGHSDDNYYRMYEFDGKYMRQITDTLMNPVDSTSPDTTPLAYWNVTDVCGKRRVIMELYNSNSSDASPVALRYKDFYIGSPYNQGEKSVASSPFYRANLQFNEISFPAETLTSVSPVSINDMIDDLSYNAPLLTEYKGPIVLLQPKGAKFEGSERPTFKYYYTYKELNHHEIDPSDISLFAIKNDGFLDNITSRVVKDDINNILILEASPDSFPGKGDAHLFVSLLNSETVNYQPEVTSISSTNIDSAKIHISTKPNKELMLIRSGEDVGSQSSTFKTASTSSVSSPPQKNTINIYTAIEAFKNQIGAGINSNSLAMSSSRWDTSEVDTMSMDVGSDGIWEGYVNLESGDNYIFVGDREALLFELIKEKGTIKNCPIGFNKITLDITGPEIVFTRDPDPLISHMNDMESIAFYPTENAYINYLKFNTKGEIDDAMTFYSLAYDTTIIYWDGKDEYGRLYEEGIYPYIVFGMDDFGNRSRDEKHQWEIRWGIPLEIVSPPSGVWLKGTQTLRSRIEGDYDYPVDWYKKWDETWGYIGNEDPSGEGLEWNTIYIPDEKNVWLKASVEDIFGHIGADSVRILGIDNHAPEIYTWVGVPKYLDEFISGLTPIFATAVDTFSGVDFFRYRIDGGSSINLRDTFNLAGYSDGRHQIDFSARDHADNVIDSTLSLYLDNTPPFSQIVFGEPKKMYNDTLYISPNTDISIEALDTCGIARSFYGVSSLSGIEIQPWTEVMGDFNIPYTPPYYRYIISYYSEDNLGNTESPRDTVVAVDCDPPVTILNIGDPQYPLPSDSSIIYITSETPLSFEATDDISGVDTTYYRIDGVSWYVYSGGVFNLTEEGSHIVEYYSIDKAGNREDINSKELRVDETHPISELTTGEPNYTLPGDSLGQILITSNTPLILTAEDPLSNGVASGVKELEYEVTPLTADRQPLSAIVEGDSTEFTITGEDGSYKVDYRARDNVLNEEPFNLKYYELDNTPPVAMIISPLDSTMVSHIITIIGTVNDKHFKEYVLEYGKGIDPGDWTTIIVSDKEVEDSVLGKLNVSCIPGDIITVRLRATDLVGNEAIDEVILWKGDLICDFDIPLHKPEGVDFDIQGNIYATDREGGKKKRCRDKVKKFDPFGNLIYEISDRYVPNDVAVTPWNNILISEQVRKEITEFDQSQEYLRSIKYLKGPDGVDVTRLPDSGMRCEDKEKGELKGLVIGVADQTANKVILYDSLFRKAREIKIIHERTLCYHHPEGISFDKQGNVYTCLINNDVVRKYDLDGNMLMQITGFNKPSDIEVDYRGYIWVTDRNNDRIRCFDAYGNHLYKYGKKGKGCGEFNKPEGIAVNHERLYVADMNNDRVQVLRFPFSVLYPNLSSIGKSRQEALSIQECVPYPNPCNPAREFSNIRVVVNSDCEIEVRIYSLTGTLLWETSITGFAGINEVTWNGMNQDNEEVRNGVYNVLVRAENGSQKDEERTKIIVYRR